MTSYQTLLKDSMYVIAEGTRIAMRRLLPKGARGYIGRMNNWTGRYDLSKRYMPFYPGYLLGRLWLLHRYTGDDEFKDFALRILDPMLPDLCQRPLASQASGLDMYYGLCWAADVTGSAKLRKDALRAVDNMIEHLWLERAGIFVISRGRASVNIDATACLFGLPWAAKYSARYMDYWTRHNDTILQLGLVRADGSSYQVAHFDDKTHEFRYYSTFQGWRPDSTWARGQSWAIQNFTAAYEATGEQRYRDTAVKTADWWVVHTKQAPVPSYDFNDPAHALPKDSCAAAITANALLRLARVVPARAEQYRRVTRAAIRELATSYLCDGGILLHGSFGNVAPGGAIPVRFPQEDIIPFGNYYFVEALYHELRDDWDFFKLAPK